MMINRMWLSLVGCLSLCACGKEVVLVESKVEVGDEAAQEAEPAPEVEPAQEANGYAPTGVSGTDTWPLGVQFPAEIMAAYDRVVLITIDTLRADHVSAYGYKRPTTPFIDSLAQRGVLFEKAMASVSHTAPSHATMLTGLPPVAHGVLLNGDTLDPEAMDLGRVFKQAGFDTAAFLNTKFLNNVATSFDHKSSSRATVQVVGEALEWIRAADRSKQFFLWVHTYEPHHWVNSSSLSEKNLAAIRDTTTLNDTDLYDYLSGLMGLPKEQEGTDFSIPWASRVPPRLDKIDSSRDYLDVIDGYDSLILHADQQVARLYRGFEEQGFGDRTLWVITSDHGEGIGSHGVAGHGGFMFQEQLHVPLIFHSMDDSLGPRRVPNLVQHVDLFPTLAATLGAKTGGIDPARSGVSIWPLIEGSAELAPRAAFGQRRPQVVTEKQLMRPNAWRPGVPRPAEDLNLSDEKSWSAVWTLQTLQSKYMLKRSGKNSYFDLENDPLELEDLIGKGGRKERKMVAEIEDLIQFYLSIQRDAYADGGIEPEVLEELRALGYVE